LLQVPRSSPTTGRAPFPTSLPLIGSLSSGATGDPASPPEVTRDSSVPCRPQSPCFWWVNENAFASLRQARPCPTLGRPVHLRGGAPRLRPGTSPHVLRIPPHGGHPTLRELQSGGCRSALAVSDFRLRARLGFSIPFPSSRPTRNYPRLWIQRSSFERRRDLNPPESRAAQRTTCVLLHSVLNCLPNRLDRTLPLGRSRRWLGIGARGYSTAKLADRPELVFSSAVTLALFSRSSALRLGRSKQQTDRCHTTPAADLTFSGRPHPPGWVATQTV